jgi:hypothetical protein
MNLQALSNLDNVDFVQDPSRINGLIAEDRIRTTNMFVKGNVAFHPTHEIDISPEADLIQGLPTHVKITKQTYTKNGTPNPLTVDMACAYKLFSLEGTHRLLVMVYEEEKVRFPDGKLQKILRFDRVIEIILSSETLNAFRGDVSVTEIGRIRNLLLGWKPLVRTPEEAEIEAEKARQKYHPMTEAIRPRQGIAHPSVKISINKKDLKVDNKRVQSSISIEKTREQVESEGIGHLKGQYRGKIIQPRYQEYDDTTGFHGLALPWRTTGHWKKLPRTGKIVAEVEDLPTTQSKGLFSKYIEQWESVEQQPIPNGNLVIMTHEDKMRTVHTEAKDNEIRKHVSTLCDHVGGRWIEEIRSWLLNQGQTEKVLKALKARDIPEIHRTSPLFPARSGKAGVFVFRTPDGIASAINIGGTKWVIRPDEKDRAKSRALMIRISSFCRAANIGKLEYHKGQNRWSWIISGEDESLIHRICIGIQKFDFLGPRGEKIRLG